MNTLIKNTLTCITLFFTFAFAQAQVTPYIGLEFRAKQDFSSVHRTVSSSITNATGTFDHGISLGARWANGLGLQLELRNATHAGQFSLKNDPAYSANTDLAKINFRHRGLFVPLFFTMDKALGNNKRWGIRGKVGGGIFLSNDAFEENQDFRGSIQSNVTGSVADFTYMTRFLDAYNDRFMVESGIGVYAHLTSNIMVSCNAFFTQSIGNLSYRVLEYDDGVKEPVAVNMINPGQAVGLQVSIQYLFNKSK